MIAIQFLAEWALRSAILILSGAVLLRALRVKDSSIRLAAWTAMLFGSLAIPALTVALPRMPLIIVRASERPADAPRVTYETPLKSPSAQDASAAKRSPALPKPFDWASAALAIYMLAAARALAAPVPWTRHEPPPDARQPRGRKSHRGNRNSRISPRGSARITWESFTR